MALASKTAILFGIVIAVIGVLFNGQLGALFINPAEAAYGLAKDAIPILFSSYLFAGVTLVIGAYFQAIEKPQLAMVLTASRPCHYPAPHVPHEQGLWHRRHVDGLHCNRASYGGIGPLSEAVQG